MKNVLRDMRSKHSICFKDVDMVNLTAGHDLRHIDGSNIDVPAVSRMFEPARSVRRPANTCQLETR